MSIKAITFDFWSTLYQSETVDYTKRSLELKETLERYGGVTLATEQFEAAVKVARDSWSRAWTRQYRTLSANEWLGIILSRLDTRLNPEHISAIVISMEHNVLNDLPALVPEAKAVLADLAGHYKLAIISDTGLTPGRVLRQLLEQDGISGYFSQLTFSDEVGHSKPHPDAFLITLKAMEVEPHEAVHVGDLLRTDIAGAQNVGMRAVQYVGLNHEGETTLAPVSPSTVKPDAIISKHTELKPLLERWNGAGPPPTG